jgi:hypothetical protein
MTRSSRTLWLVLLGVAALLALAYRGLTGFSLWQRSLANRAPRRRRKSW